jgi:hypothetical protein
LDITERCVFVKEEKIVDSASNSLVTKIKNDFKSTVVKTTFESERTEYVWKFIVEYELMVFSGVRNADNSNVITLQKQNSSIEIKTTVKSTPKPEFKKLDAIEISISWLLSSLKNLEPSFEISRIDKDCKTPTRNPQSKSALEFFTSMENGLHKIFSYFNGLEQAEGKQISQSFELNSLFNPVIPLYEADKEDGSVNISKSDIKLFLAHQSNTLTKCLSNVEKAFSLFKGEKRLINYEEASLMIVFFHSKNISSQLISGITYIEKMLENQLFNAIGKVLTSEDFKTFMNFHNRKLFAKAFQPQGFCYAIRRPHYYPEGIISLEDLNESVMTFVRHVETCSPINVPINASTTVILNSNVYLHGLLMHKFSDSSSDLSLNVRARQFSSYILLIGNMTSIDTFSPKYGVIVKDKDEILIPLLANPLPTTKEFRYLFFNL